MKNIAEGTWVTSIKGLRREVDYPELTALKKDILLFYEWNIGEGNLSNTFFTKDTYMLNYWKYLSLDGDKWFYEKDRAFYKEGCLALIVGMVHEFLDYASGNQKIFGNTSIDLILKYLELCTVNNQEQKKLFNLTRLSLIIAKEATFDYSDNDFTHPNILELIEGGKWIHDTLIKKFFENLIA